MAMSEMKIEFPQQLIEDTIRAEMVRQIGDDNKEKLIESIVKHAMTEKKTSMIMIHIFRKQSTK